MQSTKDTLAAAWNELCAIRHLPDDEFWARYREIERGAIRLHPDEEAALIQILSAYAYGVGKLDDLRGLGPSDD